MEANPESVDLHALGSLCAAGVNRISIGVQSLNDDALKSLGRSHTADQARHAIAIAREGGFSNVSADLMFGLPGQDLAEWRACLEEAFLLPIEHLSCYELCADPAAAFAHPEPGWPSEDETADQWELLMDMADANGFEHYEVANYARPGFACRHNLKYWRDTDFIGIGTGAWSSRDGIRSANLHDLTQYFAGSSRGYPPAEEIRPGSGARMAETLMLNLRLREGASEAGFSRRYGPRALDVFMPALSAHLKAGRLERGNGCIRLTRPGLLLANEVWADLLEAGKA